MLHNTFKYHQITLVLIALIFVLGSAGTVQASQPTQSIRPAQEEEVEELPDGLTVEITGPTEVLEGDTFLVEVVASNIPEPGIFGYQFQFDWDDTVFTLMEETLTLNPDFPIVARLDVGAATVDVGASREGDVPDLDGPLTLMSVELQANVVTEPDAAPFTLSAVKLGRKGGIDVPVDQVLGLDVVVLAAQNGGIVGNVQVQGRAVDNQAGHTVEDGLSLATATDANGDFLFENVQFGIYTLTANHPGFLAATCTDLIHEAAPTVLENLTLLAGDIDDNGEIDITDAVAIGAVFFSTAPDEVANLNADGEVDILDLILMSVNFGQTSAGNPWVCQP